MYYYALPHVWPVADWYTICKPSVTSCPVSPWTITQQSQNVLEYRKIKWTVQEAFRSFEMIHDKVRWFCILFCCLLLAYLLHYTKLSFWRLESVPEICVRPEWGSKFCIMSALPIHCLPWTVNLGSLWMLIWWKHVAICLQNDSHLSMLSLACLDLGSTAS